MPGPGAPYTQLSANQVLMQVFDEANDRLRTSTTVNATIDGEVAVELDAADGDNVAISDGTNTLAVNADGSINVVNINTTAISTYNEVSSVASGVLTTITTYTAVSASKLKYIAVSGDNIATYTVLIDSGIIDKERTYFGNSLNATFDFGNGLSLGIAQVVTVKVIHSRPTLGTFNARIQIEE